MLKNTLITVFLAFIFIYLSLFKVSQASVTRPEIMGCEQSCLVVAAGFPKAFVLDGVVSPINRISIDPLSLFLIKEDEFAPKNFALSFLFWFAVAGFLVVLSIYLKSRVKIR